MSIKTEQRRWDAEVDEEAARLMRLGVPTWDAIVQARQRVEQRRKLASQDAQPVTGKEP